MSGVPKGGLPKMNAMGAGGQTKSIFFLGRSLGSHPKGFPSGKVQNLRGTRKPEVLQFPLCDGFMTDSEERLPSSFFQTQSHNLLPFDDFRICLFVKKFGGTSLRVVLPWCLQ